MQTNFGRNGQAKPKFVTLQIKTALKSGFFSPILTLALAKQGNCKHRITQARIFALAFLFLSVLFIILSSKQISVLINQSIKESIMNRNQSTISPCFTLDKLGVYDLIGLKNLIHAYTYNGTTSDGKFYAPLPPTWSDSGVYADFNPYSGKVFLSNDEYQELILTKYGVMQYHSTYYSGFDGTIFELASQAMDDLTEKDGETIRTVGIDKDGRFSGVWHEQDLTELYDWLCSYTSEYEYLSELKKYAGIDTDQLNLAKECIFKAFAQEQLELADLQGVTLNDDEMLKVINDTLKALETNLRLCEYDDSNELDYYKSLICNPTKLAGGALC